METSPEYDAQVVPYDKIEWVTFNQVAFEFFGDEDDSKSYRRIRGWADAYAQDGTEFEQGQFRHKRDGKGANAKRLIALQDFRLWLDFPDIRRKATPSEQTTSAVEPVAMWEDYQMLVQRIEEIAEKKGNAEGKVEFFKEQLIPTKDAEINELRERAARLEAEVNELREREAERLAAELEAVKVIDITNETIEADTSFAAQSEARPVWWKRWGSGYSPPVA